MSVGVRTAACALCAIHVAALAAGFFAPLDPAAQFRDYAFAPPAAPTLANIQFLVEGPEYRIAGFIPCRRHLFGFEGSPAFLLGTDGLGRDQLSRLLHGAQISLLTGLTAAAVTVALALVLGGMAGFYGGFADSVVMRATEVFQTVPWLYLLIAVRASLPLHLAPARAFTLLIVIVGVVGWAKPARLIRGVALAAREHDHVAAARGFGASGWYLLRRHVLPQTYGVALTQASLLIPRYILAEMSLSFLGLGVAEPVPTWGNMLAALQQYEVMSSYWWMYLPALALVCVLLLYQALSDGLGSVSHPVRL